MRTYKNIFIVALMAISQLLAPMAMAADTDIASVDVSGNVPVIFSLTARGMSGELDLSGKSIVNARLLGIFHLKYNVSMASLTLSASTASGTPENAGTAYSFGATAWTASITCSSVLVAAGVNILASTLPLDIKSATTTLTTAGVEEDCPLTASWKGTNVTLPLAGKYSMTYTLTMVSI